MLEPPSPDPLSTHRFPVPLCSERHPRPGHSACERCRLHPRMSEEAEKNPFCVYEREAYGLDLCPHKQEPTLQLVSLRSDLPSCRITLETFRSCCALADSWRLLLVHSDTLWRRLGFAGSADIPWLGNVAKIVTVNKWTAWMGGKKTQYNTIYNIFNIHFIQTQSICASF